MNTPKKIWVMFLLLALFGWVGTVHATVDLKGATADEIVTALSQLDTATLKQVADGLNTRLGNTTTTTTVTHTQTKEVQTVPTPTFPAQIEAAIAHSDLFVNVPRTAEYYQAATHDGDTTIVYVKIPKPLVKEGVSVWKYFVESGGSVDTTKFHDLCDCKSVTKKTKWEWYQRIFYNLNKDGAARNVPKHGWTSLQQHADHLIPILVIDKRDATDILSWLTTPPMSAS